VARLPLEPALLSLSSPFWSPSLIVGFMGRPGPCCWLGLLACCWPGC
jgi:hypothetical protein